LAERDRRVFSACRERGIAVAVSMAGGYGHNIDDTVSVHLRTLQEAWASWRERRTTSLTAA
jgi:acetoin utilization deacetylase AcuC-like enzyme